MTRRLMPILVLCSAVFVQSAFSLQGDSATRAAPPPQQNPQANGPALQALGAVVEQYVSVDQAVGAELLVLGQGKVLFHQSWGFADRETARKWENDTVCNIRSMSKPVTSVAAQILIDRQQLNLDDPVAKYLDSFESEKSKSITVRQVLTHRSGLPLSILLKVDQYPTLAGQVDASGKIGPVFEPGSKFWYSDTGTDVVGRLVEKISGERLDEFVHREIFEPLGMTNSFFGIDASDKRFASIASLYLGGAEKWNRFWKPDQPLYPCAWGSQTIYSTTTDYARFLKMLMDRGQAGGRQLITEAAVDRMLEPVSRLKMMGSDIDAPTGFQNLECYYGQMLVTHRTIGAITGTPVVFGHSGSDGTNAWAWPARDLMILYFTQSRGGMTPLRIEDSIDSLIINPGTGVAEAISPELAGYLGTYIANYGGFDNEEFTVNVKNGKLILDVPGQLAFELNGPDKNNEWSFAIAPVKVTFDRNARDEVVGLRLHKANDVFEVPKKGTARAEELAKEKTGEKSRSTPSVPGDQDSQSATWNGTLRTGNGILRLVITVTETADGLTGELVSPDQGNFRTELADIASDGSVLSFSVPEAQAKFSGKVSAGGKLAEGNFTQDGVDLPLVLERSEPARMAEQKAPEVLKEAWVGKLQMGIMEPVMQFRIVALESGETAAYFDSVTEGRTGFPATWSIEEKTLTFDVAAIKLKYTGALNETGDSATGTWSQGGREVPLTLKRQPTEYSSENVWENRRQQKILPATLRQRWNSSNRTTGSIRRKLGWPDTAKGD